MNRKENKKSLLKEIFSEETFNANNEKDERISAERNKIMYSGMTVLTLILVIVGILSDIFKFTINCSLLFIIIGIVNFIMLLCFCKNNVVNQTSTFTSFIWSIITLPFSIYNLFLDKVITNLGVFVIIQPILVVLTIIFVYEIANIFYKVNNKE